MASITGGCLCGAVRFSIAGSPLAVRACWCSVCQTLAAGNATVNLLAPRDGLVVTGEVSVFESQADSGNHMRRSFCPRCGTPLFSESSARKHAIVVRVGALDDPEIGAPQSTIWIRSKPSWGLSNPSLPAHEAGPPA